MANSDYLEELIVGWLAGTNMPAAPTTLYVGLSTADPGDDAAGLAEPVGGSYARQVVTLGGVSQVGGRAQAVTTVQVDFAATAAWGLITHAALFDALSGGNMLRHAPLDNPRNIATNDTLSFLVGALIVEES